MAIPITPTLLDLETPTSQPEPEQSLDFQSGIIQDAIFPAADVTAAFGLSPNRWDVEEKAYEDQLSQWRTSALDEVDQAALDPDAYFKNDQLDFGSTVQESRMLATNDLFLKANTDGEEVPVRGPEREFLRAGIAQKLFNGEGAESEEAFNAQIVKSATSRKTKRELFSELSTEAYKSALIATASPEKAGESTWETFREKAKSHAGYSPEQEADLYVAWTEKQIAAKEAISPFRESLDAVWSAMQKGGAGSASEVIKEGLAAGETDGSQLVDEIKAADAAATAFLEYQNIAPEDRESFMNALGMLAKTLPKEEQATFFGNLAKEGGRAVDDLGRDSLYAGISSVLKSGVLTLPQTTASPIGKAPSVLTRQENENARQNFQAARNFASDVRRIERADFNPTVSAFGGGNPGIVESGIYGVPGAFASSIYARVSAPLMYLSMEGSAYDDLRNQLLKAGVSDADASARADQWAPLAAIPQTILEKFQAEALIGKLPFFEKALTAASDKIKSLAMRGLVRGAVGTMQETAIEMAQQEINPLIQDVAFALGQDVPDVKWTGPGGALDGFWKDSATTAITMLPLAFFGAVGGVSNEKRAKAFAEASDVELRALGGTDEYINEIREAAGKGQASLNAAVDSMWNNRAPESEQAKAAVTELEQQIAAEEVTAKEAQKAGLVPEFVRTSDGFSVRDTATGEELGVAPTSEQAIKMAAAHSSLVQENNADQVAFLGSLLQAVEATTSKGETATASPFSRVTAAQEAAISSKNEEQILAQSRIANPGMADVVLGKSTTEFKEGVRDTANQMNAGASVLTVVHEKAHGAFAGALASGRMTKAGTIAEIRELDQTLAEADRFLPEGEVSDIQLAEAVSEVVEATTLLTRKNGSLPAGVVSKNLAAMARLGGASKLDGSAKSLKSFTDTMREFFGAVFRRTYQIKKAIKAGTIKEGQLEAFTSKLFGLDAQDQHKAASEKVTAEILGPAFSIENGRNSNSNDQSNGTEGRNTTEGAGEPSAGEGERQGEGAAGVRGDVARAIASGDGQALGMGSESRVRSFGPDKAIKIFRPEGANVYGPNGAIVRSAEFSSIEEKAKVINALGGMDSQAVDADGVSVIIQPRGVPITTSEYESIRLPFNIVPSQGGVSRIEIDGDTYLVSDLTQENFLKDKDGVVRVADLVTGKVDPSISALPDVSDSSLSLGSEKMADALILNAQKRINNPAAKARMLGGVVTRLQKVKALIQSRGTAYNFDAFGKPYAGEANFSDEKKDILNALALLDGVLGAVPADIRGKVGGYTQLAKLDTDAKRLDYLKRKVASVDNYVEKWLKKEYGTMFEKLLDRAKPVKGKPGEKPKGKLGGDVHALFDVLRDAQMWSADEAEAHATGLESQIGTGNLTPEQEAHATLEANLVRLVADWKDADSARRASALENATSVFESGYAKFKLAKLMQQEDRAIARKDLIKDTDKTGTKAERDAKELKDNSLKGGWKDSFLGLSSFEQVAQYAFGRDSTQARKLVDAERVASNAKEDAVQEKMDGLEDLFTQLGGGAYAGEQLRFKLSQKNLKIDGLQLSEMDAITATLMWRQEDGRRHMLGPKDDNGNYVGTKGGKWHYDQAFIDQIEAKLSPEAQAVRAHIASQYAAEYAVLNPVFRELNGIDLPQNANYSPITVKPQQAQGGQTIDPVTGNSMASRSSTPGSLKTRGSAIAEPDFRDALQTYIAHTKQIQHYVAYAAFNAEASALIGNREVGNAIEAKGGKEAVGVLRSWLDLFAQGGTRDAAAHLAVNKLMGRMAGRAAGAALIGRMGVLAIQSTQLGAALAEMPTGAYALRLGKLISGNLGWGSAMKSEFIQRRIAQMPPVVKAAMEGLKAEKPNQLKRAVQAMGQWISGADALFTTGTYVIVHDYQMKQAKEMGLSGADAEAWANSAAERATERLAQPTRAATKSLYENLATSPVHRIAWAFASEGRQKLALAAWALGGEGRSLGEKTRAVAVTWVVGGMIATLLRSVIKDARDDDDELWDEKNWGAKRLALSAITGPFGGVPVLGELLESGIYKVAGEYQPEGNLLSGVGNGFKAATRIGDWGEKKPDEIMKDVEGILSGLAVFNDTISAASSLSHLARDLFGIAQNVAD